MEMKELQEHKEKLLTQKLNLLASLYQIGENLKLLEGALQSVEMLLKQEQAKGEKHDDNTGER